jgi:hypothetical protein
MMYAIYSLFFVLLLTNHVLSNVYYDRINAEINTLLEKYKTYSWKEFYEIWSESLSKEKIKEKIDKFFTPLAETSFYFDNPINLIQYLDSSTEVTLHDVRRIFKAYNQAIDMKNTYVLLHWIPYYQPWPKHIDRIVSILVDLLPSTVYVIIDAHDIESFTNHYVNFTAISPNILDPVGNIRADYLLALWKSRVSGYSYEQTSMTQYQEPSSSNLMDFRFQELIERGYDFYSRSAINFFSYTNSSREYWLMDARVEWIGLLPRILQRIDTLYAANPLTGKDKSRYHYLGLQLPSCEQLPDDEVTHEASRQNDTGTNPLLAQLLELLDKYETTWLGAHLKSLLSAMLPPHQMIPMHQYYDPILSRYSDPLLSQLVTAIRNKTQLLQEDGSLSIILAQTNGWRYEDIRQPAISMALLAYDFEAESNCKSTNSDSSDACDAELHAEYVEYEAAFSNYDIDAKHSHGGKLYRRIDRCLSLPYQQHESSDSER